MYETTLRGGSEESALLPREDESLVAPNVPSRERTPCKLARPRTDKSCPTWRTTLSVGTKNHKYPRRDPFGRAARVIGARSKRPPPVWGLG